MDTRQRSLTKRKPTGAAAMGAGPGRPKGSQNKVSRQLKEMVLEALEGAGGVDYLIQRANDPKTASAFLTLLGKVLPLQVTGSGGGPVMVASVSLEEYRRVAAELASRV